MTLPVLVLTDVSRVCDSCYFKFTGAKVEAKEKGAPLFRFDLICCE